MNAITSSEIKAIKSFDANTTVLDVSGAYYSVCSPEYPTWATMLKSVIKNCRGFNTVDTQKQVLSDMYSSGFAAIELVPADQQPTAWKWKNFWEVDVPFPVADTTYPSVSKALEAAQTWHREDTDNREAVINGSAYRALVREEQMSLLSSAEHKQQWRETTPSSPKPTPYVPASRI